jgi:hypothetical protein
MPVPVTQVPVTQVPWMRVPVTRVARTRVPRTRVPRTRPVGAHVPWTHVLWTRPVGALAPCTGPRLVGLDAAVSSKSKGLDATAVVDHLRVKTHHAPLERGTRQWNHDPGSAAGLIGLQPHGWLLGAARTSARATTPELPATTAAPPTPELAATPAAPTTPELPATTAAPTTTELAATTATAAFASAGPSTSLPEGRDG